MWKLKSSRETTSVSLAYRWRGTLTFDVPPSRLADPKHRHLSARTVATLVASWNGHFTSKRAEGLATCRYTGKNVRARVTARLAKGRSAGTLELTFHPRAGVSGGFFSDQRRRAVVHCSTGTAQSAPPHFAPSWFFRDNLHDHGRLTSDTAIIVVAGKLLPAGSARVAFPREQGRNDSVALGHIRWSNNGVTTIRAR